MSFPHKYLFECTNLRVLGVTVNVVDFYTERKKKKKRQPTTLYWSSLVHNTSAKKDSKRI